MSKIKILLFIGILIGGFGFYYLAEAAAPSLYVSPATLTKNVGEMFDISIGVNPNGNKVCVVEGKLILDKLSCRTVKMEEGLLAQSSPSCDDLYFLIGIPGCATNSKTLFTVTVKAGSAGNATANFTRVDIIGEGVSISSAFSGGSYTLISSISPPPPCNCTEWGPWQLGDCEVGGCSPIQRLQTRTRTCTPAGCDIESESQCIEDSSCLSVEEKVIPPKEKWSSLLLASLSVILETPWMIFLLILSVLGIIWVVITEWRKRKKKQ